MPKKAKFQIGDEVWCEECGESSRITAYDPKWELYFLDGESVKEEDGHGHGEQELQLLSERKREMAQ